MVYLLHFLQPYRHARHYIGFCADGKLNERLLRHVSGDGARLIAVITDAGIGFELARVWCNGTQTFERQLKKRKNSKKLCPMCNKEWRL